MRCNLVVNLILALFAVSAAASSDVHLDKNVPSIAQTAPAFTEAITAHFTLSHDLQPVRAEKMAAFLEKTYTEFFNFFAKAGFNPTAPEQRLNWLCFSNFDSFEDYANRTEHTNLSWLSSYYSAKTNSVAILLNLKHQQHNAPCDTNSTANIMAAPNNDYDQVSDTLRIGHELAHQLAFNTGLQKRKVMYPLWVSEGLATSFEMQLSGDCKGPGCRKLENNPAGLIPLIEFIPMTQLPADSQLHPCVYAQAQALFNFLMTHHCEQLRTYLQNLRQLEPGWRSSDTMVTEFTDVFGPINHLEKEWKRYISAERF